MIVYLGYFATLYEPLRLLVFCLALNTLVNSESGGSKSGFVQIRLYAGSGFGLVCLNETCYRWRTEQCFLAGGSKIFVPNAPDEVKEKSGTPCVL